MNNKLKKATTALLIFAALILQIGVVTNAAPISAMQYDDSIKVVFNGKEALLLKPLAFGDGMVSPLIPLRDVLEELGHTVTWQNETQAVQISESSIADHLRSVTPSHSSIADSRENSCSVYIGDEKLSMSQQLISVYDSEMPGYYINYMQGDEILTALGYSTKWSEGEKILYISTSEQVQISIRGDVLEYSSAQPYSEGSFSYVPLEETIIALGHSISYNTADGIISEAILTVRSNTITLPIGSKEIRIGTPVINSIITVSGINGSFDYTVTDNRVADLIGMPEYEAAPYVFHAGAETELKDGVVFVELSVLNKIFETKNTGKSSVNIIDTMVRNFQIDGKAYCPYFSEMMIIDFSIKGVMGDSGELEPFIYFTDKETGEEIGTHNYDAYIAARDFRNAPDSPHSLMKELSRKEYEEESKTSGEISAFTKNGYPLVSHGEGYLIFDMRIPNDTAFSVYINPRYQYSNHPVSQTN